MFVCKYMTIINQYDLFIFILALLQLYKQMRDYQYDSDDSQQQKGNKKNKASKSTIKYTKLYEQSSGELKQRVDKIIKTNYNADTQTLSLCI